MTDAERKALLARLDKFVDQQRAADDLSDKSSLDRAADVVALYEERDDQGRRRWAAELPPPKVTRNRGRPVDPESFSRFTRWLAERSRLTGRRAYQLRDAHEVATNYLNSVQIIPLGEGTIRPLKWLTKHEFAERIPEVWEIACELAGNRAPDAPTVRRALAQWKHDNLPKTEKKAGSTGGRAIVDRWLRDAHRLMEEYPELFVDAINRVEVEAEQYFSKEEAAA